MRGRPDALSDGGRTRIPGGRRHTQVLTAAVVGLALVAFVIWYAARDRPASDEQARPPASSAPSTSGEPSPAPTDPSTSAHPTTPPATKTQQIVTGFVRGWLLRGSASDRADALRPYAVSDLVSGLARTDVRNLPEEGTKAVGTPELELGATAVRGDYLVKLSNGQSLLVTVALVGDDSWRVVRVAPGDDEPSSIAGDMTRSEGSHMRASLSACAGKAPERRRAGGPSSDGNAASVRDEWRAACEPSDLVI